MKQTVKHQVKPVAKPAPKQQRVVKPRSRASKALFKLSAMSRPAAGHRLYAHTYAAFTVLGMLTAARKAVAKAVVVGFIGDRAVKYHIDQTRSLEEVGDDVRLTEDGILRFKERIEAGKVKEDEIEAYVHVFRTGQPDKLIEVRAEHILPAA